MLYDKYFEFKYFYNCNFRITGLDSAGPLFTPLSLDALHKSNAKFIDVIHTAGGVSGEIERRLNSMK